MKGFMNVAEIVVKYGMSAPTVRKRLRDYAPAKEISVQDRRGVSHAVSYYTMADVKAAMALPKGKPGRKPIVKAG